jgi:hypothetical protein
VGRKKSLDDLPGRVRTAAEAALEALRGEFVGLEHIGRPPPPDTGEPLMTKAEFENAARLRGFLHVFKALPPADAFAAGLPSLLSPKLRREVAGSRPGAACSKQPGGDEPRDAGVADSMTRTEFFDGLSARVRERAEALAERSGDPFDPPEFVDEVLAERRHPTGVTRDEVEDFVVDAAQHHFRAVAKRLYEHADELQQLVELAHAHGCPPGHAVVPWLERAGVIRVEDGRIVLVTPS